MTNDLIDDKIKISDLNAEYEAVEAQAYLDFANLRWSHNNGQPTCSRCSCEAIYILNCGNYRCKQCSYTFSVKSGTVFASSKLPFWKIMELIEKDYSSASKISANLDIEYKAAWVLHKKLKEAKSKGKSLSDWPVSREFKGYFQRSIPI